MVQTEVAFNRTAPAGLKGGIEPTGHHANDLERRERQMQRRAVQARSRAAAARQQRGGTSARRRLVQRYPFASVGIALGMGLLVGRVAPRWGLWALVKVAKDSSPT